MLISKKDLLKETGVSYGQLYRWKREHLIPEEWFIKQAAYTGQETFFPREQILGRIRAIQRLKDKYSLEQLAKMLSPEISDRVFTRGDLKQVEEIPPSLMACLTGEEETYTFTQVVLMTMLSVAAEELVLSPGELEAPARGLLSGAVDLPNVRFALLFATAEQRYYAMLLPDGVQPIMDGRLQVVYTARMEDAANAFKMKYRKRFNFTFDDGEGEDNG